MPYKTIQQNFSRGEINPKLLGRSDVDLYYKSAEKMRNVTTIPFGGFTRREGTQYIDQVGKQSERIATVDTITAPNGGNTANVNDNNRGTFFTTNDLNTTSPFVAVQYQFTADQDIVYLDLLDLSLNSSTAEATVTLVTNASINVSSNSFNDGIKEMTVDLVSIHSATTGESFQITYDDGAGNTYTRDVVITVVDTDTAVAAGFLT